MTNNQALERLKSISPFDVAYHMPFAIKKSVKDAASRDLWAFSSSDEATIETYLNEAIAWILRAQAHSGCGGVPASYTFYKGYTKPYPETTGYMIPSMLASYHYFHTESYKGAAIDMANWLVSLQLDNGAIRCNISPKRAATKFDNAEVFLFDLGAILEGFTSIWKETREDMYKTAAIRLGDYITRTQEGDGLWKNDLFFPYFGSHQARTMWALIEAGKSFSKPLYVEAALKCLEIIKAKVNSNGFITGCVFRHSYNEETALTHPIGYTLEGLFRAGIATGAQDLRDTAIDVAHKLQRIAEDRKQMFFANYDTRWKPKSNYQCVTGNIQIAMIWLEIAKYSGDNKLALTATRFLALTRSNMVDITTPMKGVRGGLPGSFPIFGMYQPFAFPNWATKFFIDASLLELERIKLAKHKK
jgi:hypothetical protein